MSNDKELQLQRANYGISAFWGPRTESADQLADRMAQTLIQLRAIDRLFHHWFFVHEDDGVPLHNVDRPQLAALIADHVSRDDFDVAEVEAGYYFTVVNKEERSPRSAHLQFHAGCSYFWGSPSNSASFGTDEFIPQDAALFTPVLFRQVLLALVTAWDPNWCKVGSSETRDLSPPIQETRTPKLQLAWMTYLAPRFALLVTPPKSAIVERTPEGGLLMIASEERFSVANPEHLRVAREIEASLAPVNALPWSERGA